ncbi:MAG: DUF308 domain-containing protein [Xanthomonadales bacterium]|nr:DUF308 domain-containing protein [Xanthomonadales bacterium]
METIIDRIHRNTSWAIVIGVLLIVGGVIAMASPVIAGMSVALMVGWLLAFGGVFQTLFAFRAKAGVLAIILGLLTLAAGVYMILNPGVAVATLVLFLAIYLLLSGISEVIIALSARPADGWGWLLLNAIASILLGGLMFTQFPVAGAMAIGILLGLKLLFTGLMMVMIATTVRKATKRAKTA